MYVLETSQKKSLVIIRIFQLAQIYLSVSHVNLCNLINLEGKMKKQNYRNWKTLSHLGGAVLSIVYFQSKMINIPICDKFDVNVYYLMQKQRVQCFCSYLFFNLNSPQFNCILLQHISFLFLFLEHAKMAGVFLLISLSGISIYR